MARTTDDTWVEELLDSDAAGETWGMRFKRGGRWATALAVPGVILAITFHGGARPAHKPVQRLVAVHAPRTMQPTGLEALRAVQPVSEPVRAAAEPHVPASAAPPPPETDDTAPQDQPPEVDAPTSPELPWKPPRVLPRPTGGHGKTDRPSVPPAPPSTGTSRPAPPDPTGSASHDPGTAAPTTSAPAATSTADPSASTSVAP